MTELAPVERGAWGGIAFGAEFCHRLLPSVEEVLKAEALCRARDMGFSLVTPLVREGAFADVSRWLERLAAQLEGREWVASDWGLLLWAHERGLSLRPVAGRLLGRQRRGPRVLAMIASAAEREVSALRGSVWDDLQTSILLQEFGVQRVELDFLLQGVRRPHLPPDVALSLCGPWIPVTLSPSCPWSRDPLHCPRPCLGHAAVRLRNEEDPHPLWSRGNATLARVPWPPPDPELTALGADRLVWAVEIPG